MGPTTLEMLNSDPDRVADYRIVDNPTEEFSDRRGNWPEGKKVLEGVHRSATKAGEPAKALIILYAGDGPEALAEAVRVSDKAFKTLFEVHGGDQAEYEQVRRPSRSRRRPR